MNKFTKEDIAKFFNESTISMIDRYKDSNFSHIQILLNNRDKNNDADIFEIDYYSELKRFVIYPKYELLPNISTVGRVQERDIQTIDHRHSLYECLLDHAVELKLTKNNDDSLHINMITVKAKTRKLKCNWKMSVK